MGVSKKEFSHNTTQHNTTQHTSHQIKSNPISHHTPAESYQKDKKASSQTKTYLERPWLFLYYLSFVCFVGWLVRFMGNAKSKTGQMQVYGCGTRSKGHEANTRKISSLSGVGFCGGYKADDSWLSMDTQRSIDPDRYYFFPFSHTLKYRTKCLRRSRFPRRLFSSYVIARTFQYI